MLTPHQVADRTGLSYHVVLRAIHAGELRATKLRGRILIDETWLQEWVDRNLIEPRTVTQRHLEPVSHRPRRPPAKGSLAALRSIEQGGP